MNWLHELKNLPRWKKYSQADEECYLEHILNHLPQESRHIVELGAWDGYHLSNTRYFIEKGYTALLIDGDNRGNKEVKEHFITKRNILDILADYKTPTHFDLLCLDLDGNDLYILEEILSGYIPSVIICEFNPIHKPNESKTIPYDEEHTWGNDDYYGFSFLAGVRLAQTNGYSVVHQNDNLNLYMVENNVLAKTLGVPLHELGQHIPTITYDAVHYHPISRKQTWVDYEP